MTELGKEIIRAIYEDQQGSGAWIFEDGEPRCVLIEGHLPIMHLMTIAKDSASQDKNYESDLFHRLRSHYLLIREDTIPDQILKTPEEVRTIKNVIDDTLQQYPVNTDYLEGVSYTWFWQQFAEQVVYTTPDRARDDILEVLQKKRTCWQVYSLGLHSINWISAIVLSLHYPPAVLAGFAGMVGIDHYTNAKQNHLLEQIQSVWDAYSDAKKGNMDPLQQEIITYRLGPKNPSKIRI